MKLDILKNAQAKLISSVEYKSWKKRNRSLAGSYETYVNNILAGGNPSFSYTANVFAHSLFLYASGYLDEIIISPPPDDTIKTLSFPQNSMETYYQNGGFPPYFIDADTWIGETNGSGLSRVHWIVSKSVGESFAMGGIINYADSFRGVIMRLENYNSQMVNLNQLELVRFKDGKFYVTQGLYNPSSGSPEYNIIIDGIDIPQNSSVELSGTLSTKDGYALTTLKVGGITVGVSTRKNWSMDSEYAQRARYLIVEGSQIVGACKVSVKGAWYR